MPPPPLSQFTTLGLGGPAKEYETVRNEAELIEFVSDVRRRGVPLHILGGGSNVVVSDEGVDGAVAKMELGGITTHRRRGKVWVTAAAGENWSDFVADMVSQNFAGLECLGGIPGSVGATPIQNVGAYGQEVSQVISQVRVLNKQTSKIRTLTRDECQFAYRSSLFKTSAKEDYVVVSVTFCLRENGPATVNYAELKSSLGETPSLGETHETVLRLRKNKSMVYDPSDENHRSCGSFFVNAQVDADQLDQISRAAGSRPPFFEGERGLIKIPSAWLIERAGFSRGQRSGAVGLSTKHTLCLVAHAGATSADLVRFARSITSQVFEKFAVRLHPEPNFWGFRFFEADLPLLS